MGDPNGSGPEVGLQGSVSFDPSESGVMQ